MLRQRRDRHDPVAAVVEHEPLQGTLQRVVDGLQTADCPGAVLRVQTPDGACTAAGEWFDVVTRQPLRTCDAFRIASVTKSATAVAALRLSARGVLPLDTPVGTSCRRSCCDAGRPDRGTAVSPT